MQTLLAYKLCLEIKFTFSFYNFSGVRVNAPIYAEIATITAVDIDAEASPIEYHIENTTFFRPR